MHSIVEMMIYAVIAIVSTVFFIYLLENTIIKIALYFNIKRKNKMKNDHDHEKEFNVNSLLHSEKKEDPKIEIGSIVKLKSDGPKMTVEQVNEEVVTCKWFSVGKDEFFDSTFKLASLQLI